MKPQAEAMFKLKAKLLITILNQSTVVLLITRWWENPSHPAHSCNVTLPFPHKGLSLCTLLEFGVALSPVACRGSNIRSHQTSD